MYWTHVARKDFADAVRSKLFWALSIFMILLAFLGLYVPQAIDSEVTASDGIATLSSPMFFLLPIIALVVGYMSIVGERETGSIRMVLSLPLRRGEVLVGKFVGRAGVIVVPILVAFGLAAPFVFLLYGSFPANEYGEFVTQVVLLGVVFIAFSVGISGSVDSRGKALGLVVGLFLLFQWFWGFISVGLYFLANGELPETGEIPAWIEFVSNLSPGTAISSVTEALFSLSISTDEPLLLQEWVSGIIVVLWIVVPLGVGYLRFQRADIS